MAVIELNNNYYEYIESESPSKVAFTHEGTSAVMTFVITGDLIVDFVKDVLGYSYIFANSYVKRVVPANHPLFPFLWASKIVSIKGYAPNGKLDNDILKIDSTYKNIDTKYPPYVGNYDYYKMVVEFTSRNYLIMDDDSIFKYSEPDQPYYVPTIENDIDVKIVTRKYTKRYEWLRYFNIEQDPNTEFYTFGNGNYRLKGGALNTFYDLPLSASNTGSNNLIYTTYNVSWNWYYVPYSIAFNNWYWSHAYSTINLNTFVNGLNPYYNTPLTMFDKGKLLFKKIEVEKYPPSYPFQTLNLVPGTIPNYYAQYNDNILCDVKFKMVYKNFLFTNTFPPDPTTYDPFPCKDVESPHNLVANAAHFVNYYVETQKTLSKAAGKPIFWSTPFEAIFGYSEVEPPLA